MFRWICFTVCACALVCASFGYFVWSYRTDLTASLISRSCRPYKASIGSVTFTQGTLILKDLEFVHENEIVKVSHASFKGNLSSWLSYILLPFQNTLDLDEVTLSSLPKLNIPSSAQKTLAVQLHLHHLLIEGDPRQFSEVTGTIQQIFSLS